MKSKICKDCLVEKEITAFYAVKNTNHVQSYCKECVRIRSLKSKRKLSKTSKYKEAKKLYAHKNKERLAIYHRERRAKIKEAEKLLMKTCKHCGSLYKPKPIIVSTTLA